MDKRKLSAIERAEATDEMIDIASRLSKLNWIVTAEMVGKKILLLNFHSIKDLAKGNKKAVFRTFLSQDDYITQDLRVSNIKWITSAFHNMFCDYNNYYGQVYSEWWSTEGHTIRDYIFINSAEDKKLIEKFFKKDIKSSTTSVWQVVYRFQKGVMEKRLEARHKKETDAIDKVMSTVKPVPKKFVNWIKDVKLPKYLVYNAISKSKVECECTHCKSKMVVDKKILKPKNNDTSICPHCGKEVIFKVKGRLACRTDYKNYVAYIDPTDNGFIMRYFHIIRQLYRSELKVHDFIAEVCRSFYSVENGKLVLDKSYEWTVYKNTKIRWCNDEGKINCGYGFLYDRNLPEAWEHTPMKYSALEILARETPFALSRIIERYNEFPKLEWIIKMGLFNIAKQFIDNGATSTTYANYANSTFVINWDGKTIYDILMLDKVNVRLLQAMNGDKDILTLLQASQRNGFRFSMEQLNKYYELYGTYRDLLNEVGRNVTLHKIMKYIERESSKYPEAKSCYYADKRSEKDKIADICMGMAYDWIEYIGWCEALKYDLSNMFIYMPNNFLTVHDRTAIEYQMLKDRLAAEKQKMFNNIIMQMKENSENIPVFNLHKNGLFIKLPDNSEEIKREGRILHHCVGGYVDRVAEGKTIILFIRQESNPGDPFYTLEWKGEVVQCRGYHNCDMTDEVKQFVSLFTSQMVKYEKSLEKAKVS
ncbi:MAG: PcfJ domain-containing protein [Clostridia bacterium]|nr:PcfJ domain-containing protein [Clostridia bacterium]